MTILNTSTTSTVDLASSAVIVDVRVSVYTGKKSDSVLANKVAHDGGAKDKALSVVHDLFHGDGDLKALLNNRSLVDAWLKRETYDWLGNQRLLPTYKLIEFAKDFKIKQQHHDDLVEKLIAGLPQKKANAKFSRGIYYNEADYPTAEEIRGSFSMAMTVTEVPVGDFRNAIAQDVAADLRQQFEQQATDFVGKIQDKQTEVLKDLLTRISTNAAVEIGTNAKGEQVMRRKRLHESTIQQAFECCERIEKFNISHDPKLEQVRKSLAQALEGVDPASISNSETRRAQLKSDVDDILSKF